MVLPTIVPPRAFLSIRWSTTLTSDTVSRREYGLSLVLWSVVTSPLTVIKGSLMSVGGDLQAAGCASLRGQIRVLGLQGQKGAVRDYDFLRGTARGILSCSAVINRIRFMQQSASAHSPLSKT